MSDLPHYFVAIPLPKYIKEYFSQWQKDLKERLSYKLWPHIEDLHITLKFLGPVTPVALQKLQNELLAIQQLDIFTLKVGTIGTFGNPKNPRVLWAGVEKIKPLVLLQEQVEECAIKAGFTKENRDYHPHITIAKKWAEGKINDSFFAEIKKQYIWDWEMKVDEIVIYQIFPSRSPKYKIIQTYSLKKTQ